MATQIVVTFPGGKKVDALVGGKTVHTDQPASAGGDDSAPAPFELFAASLAACAGYFVLAFCQARGLSTGGISLRQRIAFDDAHRARDFDIEISVPPDFPDKYRTALALAASGCTVKRTIEAQPRFSVRTSVELSPSPEEMDGGLEERLEK
jgi:ribosomal protein S12 methylthiotransferase accessory factor